jgi:lipooligosaccharide transport system ATP-binding protein
MSHGKVVAQGAPLALLAEHVGTEATEYYGPPDRLAALEARAAAAGLLTRRTGPAVSVLGSEAVPADLLGDLGEGVRRAANLEDVFVLLTGERLE